MYEVAGEIIWVPLLDIYVDPKFNCRGRFIPQEVHELGQSLIAEGQRMPLLIQPIGDVPDNERPDPCTWPFRLIAGNRRYSAIDNWTDIDRAKCIIEKGLSPQQARALNFTENLQRKDLNMVEEALALKITWPAEEIKDIASMVGKPKRWVKVRFDLLTLPEYVQKSAAQNKGGLSQYDVERLAELPLDRIESAFQEIVTTKGTGKKPRGLRGYRWGDKPRGKDEIKKTIGIIYESYEWAGLSIKERKLVVSTLSWVTKNIQSTEFLENRLGYPDGCIIVDELDKIAGFKDTEGDEMKF